MTLEQFRTSIAEITKLPLSEIREDCSFRDELGIDSLQLVNLIVTVADTFGLDLARLDSLEDIGTVEKMYQALGKGA